MNVDGADLRKLARGLAGTWSPDGTQIVYTTGFPGRMFVMRSDGSHKRPVGRVVGAEPRLALALRPREHEVSGEEPRAEPRIAAADEMELDSLESRQELP